MARPKFVQTKLTSLKIGISATEASEIVLRELVDVYGNDVSISDYGNIIYFTFNPGGENEEVIACTGFTRNSDGSVTLNTGIQRGRAVVAPYGAGGTARPHAGGTIVAIADTPHLFEAILDYIDEVAIAGGANATESSVGFMELSTEAEIDADEDAGTAGPLAITPAKLALSKYGLRLPSTQGKVFLNAVTGMLFPFSGTSTPAGFLMADGTAYNISDYPDLAAVCLARYGYGSGNDFTADNTTNVFTKVSHGMSNGQAVLVNNVGGALPSGLAVNTLYYVINATTNTFQLSTSVGGSAVDITTNGTGTQYTYTTFKLPNLCGSVPIGSGQKIKTFNFVDANVNTSTEVITVDSNLYLYTGQSVVLSNSGGTLPGGLSAGTYYVIRVTSTTIKLATSVENANNGTAVNITSAAGGGTHTLTITMTSRSVGQEGGTEYTAEVPSHSHLSVSQGSTDSGYSSSGTSKQPYTSPTGGNEPNNMPPFVVVNWLIKT